MTVELARTEVTEHTGGPVAKRHLLPALGLFLLAPLVGEFLLGNLPITSLGLLLLLAVGALLLWRWSGRADWSPQHELAAAGGLLLTYAWYGFVQIPSAGSASPEIDLVGNAVFAAGAVALLAIAAWRLNRLAPQ